MFSYFAFRSGTEGEYRELNPLLESITLYRRDFAELRYNEKAKRKKKMIETEQ